jgi:hypothetical protein
MNGINNKFEQLLITPNPYHVPGSDITKQGVCCNEPQVGFVQVATEMLGDKIN